VIRAFARAVIASLIVALIVPAVLFLAVHKASVPKAGVQMPSDFHTWSPREQREWTNKNFELVGGVEYVRIRMREPTEFAIEYGISAAPLFAVGLATCLVFMLLGRLHSNSVPHTDARATSALNQPPSARAGDHER
jgi:hypothetical protein